MKKSTFSTVILFILIFLGSAFTSVIQAQVLDPELGPRAWKKENVEQKGKAIELTHIREADVMWATRTWREIDMRQKINHPLYFPVGDSAIHGKRSFVQIIYDLYLDSANFMKNYNDPLGVKLFETSQFERECTWEYISTNILSSVSVIRIDPVTCDVDTNFVTQPGWLDEIKPSLTKVKLMEDWFFDKQRSIMDVRILGLGIKFPEFSPQTIMSPSCGQLTFSQFDPNPDPNAGQQIWFFYPQLRDDLAVLECYQRHNDAARLSYDDIFVQRIFESYIYREENVYNRSILDYTLGLDALLEAEKIKNDIFEFEQNVWHY